MEIILLERVEKLGQIGDVVKVKPGYARNFLLPQGKALRANKANLERFETEKSQREADNLARRSDAETEAGKMDGVSVWGEIKDIVLPLAWGGLASTALLCFIFCWNEAYWTVRLTTTDAATLSKLIEGNRAPEGLFFGRLSAVSTAAVGPIVVLGWFCQKQLVRGLTFGAVK